MNGRQGLIAGGNWIVDQIKLLERWPEQDTLAGIAGEARGNGGSPYNLLKDLARLGARFPLEAIGLVGDDERGRWIRADCAEHGIDTRQLRSTAKAPTSYTDVMTVRPTGRRTFFHQRGANALLAPAHFQFGGTRAKLFHLGYLLLLDALDAAGPEGTPRSCAVLDAARQAGLLTSADLVSDASGRFAEVVLPALPHVDILFVNDYEAGRASGEPLRRGDRLDPAQVGRAARKLLQAGVRRWVVIHFPEGAYACDQTGNGIWQAALRIPPAEIKGAAGAGDALAAGVLYGLHEDWPMPRALLLGVAAAATSLFDPTCSAGIQPIDDCFRFADRAGFGPLPH